MSSAKLIIPKNPVQEFVDRIEALNGMPDFEVFHHRLIVAKFIRTHAGASGSILTSKQTQLEDQYQGKIGLVVKVGPGAFQDQGEIAFRDVTVSPGDWVFYRMGDGNDFDYLAEGSNEKIHMRMLEDVDIKGRVKNPNSIW